MHISLLLVVFSWAGCSISYSTGSFCRKCLMQVATLEGAGWDDWDNCSPSEHSFIFLPDSTYAQNKWDFWPWSASRPCSAFQIKPSWIMGGKNVPFLVNSSSITFDSNILYSKKTSERKQATRWTNLWVASAYWPVFSLMPSRCVEQCHPWCLAIMSN